MRRGSKKAHCASEKGTSCFAWFSLSFASSHSKWVFFIDIPYHSLNIKGNINIWIIIWLKSGRCRFMLRLKDILTLPARSDGRTFWLTGSSLRRVRIERVVMRIFLNKNYVVHVFHIFVRNIKQITLAGDPLEAGFLVSGNCSTIPCGR